MKLNKNSLKRLRDRLLKVVAVGVMLVVLCEISFYLGGRYCSVKYEVATEESTSVQVKFVAFPQCSADLQDYTPCTDPKVYCVTR
ncbi:hypothetical protein M8C21_019261 [Ambrosia artemisiifolia]|uniref:Uncharacterized protein n=1 Tax=Ambrosia artemisiifolia TaxID=4212 RepID=A0AAD5BLK5_AMBAR|nr:hypothetical protein M8C21_019261 [Ambrosia artemisiifolia]